jgi:hypothetical protein
VTADRSPQVRDAAQAASVARMKRIEIRSYARCSPKAIFIRATSCEENSFHLERGSPASDLARR